MLKLGYLIHMREVTLINNVGELIQANMWVKALVELYIKDGMVKYRRGAMSKRGSYPNIHRCFESYNKVWEESSIMDVQFFEADLYDRSSKGKKAINDVLSNVTNELNNLNAT